MGEAIKKPEVDIAFVSKEHIDTVWNDVSPMIAKVINTENPETNLMHIYSELKTGVAWLVVVVEQGHLLAAFVCTQGDYPLKRVLFIEVMAGKDMWKWRHQIVDFLKIGAKKIGATEIECHGRRGFEKMYKDVAKFKHVTISIEVN